MEPVDGIALFVKRVDKIQHGAVAVFLQFRIEHAGALIAQRALGQQNRPAGEARVEIHDARDGAAADQKEVEIAAVRLKIAVPGPVIALFAAEIENGLVEVVKEDAHGAAAGAVQPDAERDVFVQRVRPGRVVAHGVGRAFAQEHFVFVQSAGFLAESVEAVVLVHPAVRGHAAVAVQCERHAGKRAVQHGLVGRAKREAERGFFHRQDQAFRAEHNGGVVLRHLGDDRIDAAALVPEQRVHPVRPCGRGQHVRFLGHAAVKAGAQTHDLVRHEHDLDVRAVGVDKKDAGPGRAETEILRANFHMQILSIDKAAPRSSPERAA